MVLTGVKLLPREPMEESGGDLNFFLADENMSVTAAVQKAEMYEMWEKQEVVFHTDSSGIGDEAFESPSIGEARQVLRIIVQLQVEWGIGIQTQVVREHVQEASTCSR